MSVIDLIFKAGFLVQMVMLILFTLSVGSWAILLLKRQLLNQASKQNGQFLQGFWGGWNLSESFSKASDYPLSPVAKCFQSGIRELRKIQEKGDKFEGDRYIKLDLVVRALKKGAAIEMSTLENSLSFLATTASSAPFIGLFGTVWGIMSSFQSIGAAGSASLATVAPGISEALVATAFGLAAAIPAGIGYNFMVGKIRDQSLELESFHQDLLNLLQREGAI
jgi:biopolymer transport protein TolQ